VRAAAPPAFAPSTPRAAPQHKAKGRPKLNLRGNRIGDAGAVALAASPHLARLRRLQLTDNPVGDAGAVALAASSFLASLNELWIFCCRIGGEGKRALQERFGDRVHT
jgi:hypothetical protein